MPKNFEYNWRWSFQSSKEKIWKLVSNTDLFNYKSNLSGVELKQSSSQLNAPQKILTMKKFGMNFDYVEEPFEWIRPHRFSVVRRFLNGPIENFIVKVELSERKDGDTDMIYEVSASAKNILGWIAIPFQIGFLSRKIFDEVFKQFDDNLQNEIEIETRAVSFLNETQKTKIVSIAEKLKSETGANSIVDKLLSVLEFADEYSLKEMRPYELAEIWREDRKETLKVFLYATRYSLLDLHWDLLCPLCRGAHASPKDLSEINSNLHCDSCNIDYTVNLNQLVEVTFTPNESIRKINIVDYCVGGPQVTPHIISQQNIEPGRSEDISLTLEVGRYRIRTWKFPSGQLMTALNGGDENIFISIDHNGWKNEELKISLSPKLTMQNKTGELQQFIIERMEWSDKSTTAAEVIALQTFRDLFAESVLKRGEQISVGSLCILFTDLKSSTQLYRQIGDATAFGLVLDHFKLLKSLVEKNEGALIKTIGDAVMAVFKSPLNSIKFIQQSRFELSQQLNDLKNLKLKAGANYGACIAVNLNEKLDYFGSTVNFASRLESFSSGEDMIISEKIFFDPEVKNYLEDKKNSIFVEPFEANLKGFDSETFKLFKLNFGKD